MGKIVKYCSACEESFAEKFAFCPNCAQPMTAFEMNPISGDISGGGETKLGKPAGQTIIEGAKPPVEESILEIPVDEPISEPIAEPIIAEPIIAEPIAVSPTVVQATPKEETPKIGDTKIFAASNQTQTYNLADLEELGSLDKAQAEESAEEEFVPETKTFAAAAGVNASENINYQTDNFQTNFAAAKKTEDDGYHITVIEEKNSKQRNGLLLGTLVIMVMVGLGSAVFSIFNKDYGIGAIDSDNPVFLAVVDEVPMEVEKEEPKKADDDGGGGGGGGRKEQTETSQGRLATQTEKPLIAPTKTIIQRDNPELKSPIASTQGNRVIPPTVGPYGDPNSKNTLSSDGTGSGGGQGSGTGTGQGSGRGTGMGSGLGSGSGSGKGDGNGGGDGPGSGIPKPPPPPRLPERAVGPPTPINIISKPQPRYTDAARTNNITGVVTLKVTFMANGQIGSVVPVSGLPNGLTEQAIAAAKAIRFDPPKRGGVPYSVSKTITYNFTIY